MEHYDPLEDKQPSAWSFVRRYSEWRSAEGSTIFSSCRFDVNQYKRSHYADFGVEYPDALARAVNKRQAEYLAGRYVAHRMLDALGAGVDVIGCGEHRNPIWPTGVVASITHTDSHALCVGAMKHSQDFIGIDTEAFIARDTARDVQKIVIDEYERARMLAWPIPFELALTAVFSSKESLFKALYPTVQEYFGFEAARVTGICPEQSWLELTLSDDFLPSIRPHQRRTYRCSLQWSDDTVTTLLIGRFDGEPDKAWHDSSMHNEIAAVMSASARARSKSNDGDFGGQQAAG